MQQLVLYETLLGSASRSRPQTQGCAPLLLLSHQPFLKPMLQLLKEFEAGMEDVSSSPASPTAALFASKDTQMHLVLLLNILCKRLMENVDLLDLFFHASHVLSTARDAEDSDSSFPIFSILIRFLHSDGHSGQLARDALLHCMALSRKNEDVGIYIAKHSNFCTVSSRTDEPLPVGLCDRLLDRRNPVARMRRHE